MASFCVASFIVIRKDFSIPPAVTFHTRQLNKDSISPTLEARVIADDYCGKEKREDLVFACIDLLAKQ
jgi:hypothetical protein